MPQCCRSASGPVGPGCAQNASLAASGKLSWLPVTALEGAFLSNFKHRCALVKRNRESKWPPSKAAVTNPFSGNRSCRSWFRRFFPPFLREEDFSPPIAQQAPLLTDPLVRLLSKLPHSPHGNAPRAPIPTSAPVAGLSLPPTSPDKQFGAACGPHPADRNFRLTTALPPVE